MTVLYLFYNIGERAFLDRCFREVVMSNFQVFTLFVNCYCLCLVFAYSGTSFIEYNWFNREIIHNNSNILSVIGIVIFSTFVLWVRRIYSV